LPASQCRLLNRFLRLLLAADEQDFASASRNLLEKFRRPPKLENGLVQINDVNLVAPFKDERLHLWIPTLRLMPKMDTSFQ
jgi:hypothetical protein